MLLLPLCQVTADSPSDAVSVWDIINLSADSHPIHLHNVDFEVCETLDLNLHALDVGQIVPEWVKVKPACAHALEVMHSSKAGSMYGATRSSFVSLLHCSCV